MTEAPVKPQYSDHIGLIHMQAKFGYKWACGAGAHVEYDDMFQEACIAFLDAAEGFDPEKGIKFSAYFTKASFSQFRKTIGHLTGVKNLNLTQRAEIQDRREENKRRGLAAEPPLLDRSYGLRPVNFSELGGGEEAMSFEDTLVSDMLSPEQILEHKQNLEQAFDKLSPLAQLVVTWLKEPPAELLRELSGQMAHADVCNSHGLRAHGLRNGVSIDRIGKFLNLVSGVPKDQIAAVETELLEMAQCLT